MTRDRLACGFRRATPAVLSGLLLASAARAAPLASGSAAAGSATAPWTVDDILLAEQAGSPRFTPDGQHLVWVKSALDKEKGTQASNFFLSEIAGGKTVQLTRGSERLGTPEVSPDGQRLLFASSRAPRQAGTKPEDGPKTRLWLLSLAGGEPWVAAELPREPSAYAWQDDAHVLFLAKDGPAERQREAAASGDDAVAVDDAAVAPPVRLFRLTLASGKVERLSDNRDWIDLLAVSPDGRWAVTRHQQSLRYDYDQAEPPLTFLIDLGSGARRPILDPGVVPDEVRFEPGSGGFYFTAQRSSHPRFRMATVSELFHATVPAGAVTQVDLDWGPGLDESPVLPLADGVLVPLAAGVTSKPARFKRTATGWERQWLTGTHVQHLWDWAVSPDGATLVYEQSTASQPQQWWRARLDGAALREEAGLIQLNPGYARRQLPRSEVVRFPGARGDEVEAILRYPLDYREGERRPLILATHGGPLAHDTDSWYASSTRPLVLFNQQGAFTLEVNYHGSSGYGLAWAESIAGHYYELEVPDLEAGVDALIARGLVDPERLGTLGWSNGGILSADLITRTQRYKAASIGAADVEWFSDWGNVDFGVAFDNYYFGGSPLELPDVYREKSPFFRLGSVTTPTLIFSGSEDRNVPHGQSWSLFRALQQLGKAPVRFVVFPGEPHGLGRYAHRRRKVEEDLAWFDRYLFGKPPVETVVKAGSPLELALARTAAARANGHYGRLEKGVLVPEVVRAGGLELGRFEVTRAQYAAFDPTYRFPAGSAELPASGITFERARAYVAWLSQRTGSTFRLPTAAEVSGLAARQQGKGNTLDTWAGFAPTPEEAAALLVAATRLGPGGPLVAEVGTHDVLAEAGDGRGTEGANAVFDLGGNVAEWVVGDDGEGKLLGGSADRPAEPLGGAPAGADYQGFRVVRVP